MTPRVACIACRPFLSLLSQRWAIQQVYWSQADLKVEGLERSISQASQLVSTHKQH